MNQSVAYDQITIRLEPPLDQAKMELLLSVIRSLPGVQSVSALGTAPAADGAHRTPPGS